LNTQALGSSETLDITYRTTCCHNQEHHTKYRY